MRSPIVLHYIDEFNEKINIDDEKTLTKALEKAIYDHQKKGAQGPIVLELIVASPLIKGLRNYVLADNKSNMFSDKMCKNDLSWKILMKIDNIFQGYNNTTNLMQKDSLLEDLRRKTNLDKLELEQIYNSFVQVTTKRFQNKSEGSVNFQEFSTIMKYIS